MSNQGTILVVDDTATNLNFLVDVVTQAGYKVRPATSGMLALAAVAANPPDMILLDLCLPDIDGLEVCRRLKARAESRDIPILFITASEGPRHRVEGLKAGAVDFISKPILSEELMARIQTHMELSRSRALLIQQAAAIRETNAQLESEIARRQRVEDELRLSLDRAERSRRAMLSFLEDQKRTEAALKGSLERFELAIRATFNVIWDWNPVDNMFWLSPHFQTVFGHDPAEVGPGLEDWTKRIHPDDRDRVEKGYLAALSDGSALWRDEYRLQLGDGTYADVDDRGVISRNSAGEVVRIIGAMQDITERKLAQQERDSLQGQLLQSQKMESVGRLAGGVAHDFNNMLSVILGSTSLAMESIDQSNPLYAAFSEIRGAAERSAALTRQLLGFARKQTVAPRVLDLNNTIGRMLDMLRRLIGEDIDLRWIPAPVSTPVKMDPSQIDQILTNLCVNARDAIGDVGKLTIETENVTLDDAYCAQHVGFLPGDYVRLAVSDDGCGMSAEIQSRVFEPFFTTKAIGHGSGLGLATVYGIVKQNRGFINVYSEPGHGSTFAIYFSRHVDRPTHIEDEAPAARAVYGHETVLIVEDEPAILRLNTKMLETLGYNVLAAASPVAAIQVAEEYRGNIHLLMTDVIMPEMNGRELAKRLLALDPTMRRLFTSGYTANVIAHHGVLDEGVHFIQKPFSMEALAAKVREVLDQE